MVTIDDSDTVLDLVVNEDTKRITLIKRKGYGNRPFYYQFVAEIPGSDKTEEWPSEHCNTLEEAEKWITDSLNKRKRAQRIHYDFPVTVKLPTRLRSSPVRYAPATIHGINATSGDWRITQDGKKKSIKSESTYRRMTDADAKMAGELEDKINTNQKYLEALHVKYDLNLPYTSYHSGRIGIDSAIRSDEKMAELFAEQ